MDTSWIWLLFLLWVFWPKSRSTALTKKLAFWWLPWSIHSLKLSLIQSLTTLCARSTPLNWKIFKLFSVADRSQPGWSFFLCLFTLKKDFSRTHWNHLNLLHTTRMRKEVHSKIKKIKIRLKFIKSTSKTCRKNTKRGRRYQNQSKIYKMQKNQW